MRLHKHTHEHTAVFLYLSPPLLLLCCCFCRLQKTSCQHRCQLIQARPREKTREVFATHAIKEPALLPRAACVGSGNVGTRLLSPLEPSPRVARRIKHRRWLQIYRSPVVEKLQVLRTFRVSWASSLRPRLHNQPPRAHPIPQQHSLISQTSVSKRMRVVNRWIRLVRTPTKYVTFTEPRRNCSRTVYRQRENAEVLANSLFLRYSSARALRAWRWSSAALFSCRQRRRGPNQIRNVLLRQVGYRKVGSNDGGVVVRYLRPRLPV